MGVELVEGAAVGQPGHRHVDELAVMQRPGADGQLRAVGVGLDDLNVLPERQPGQALSGLVGADEVGYVAMHSRLAHRTLLFEPVPDTLTDLMLGLVDAHARWIRRSVSRHRMGG
ncbi:hypothetical protein [Actinomadura gamaensis]|uniref:Uncharacterized protein n=1 Tax=Actinomadura gamaensis TaxID=1763541 RepID=A0ABV9U230_9ACTN